MADNTSIVIAFGAEDAGDRGAKDDTGARITMEQRGGGGTTGYKECMENSFSEGQIVDVNEYFDAAVGCGETNCNDDGDFDVEVLVKKVPVDLNYTFTVTRGEVGVMYVEGGNYSESLNVNRSDVLSIPVALEGEPSAYWEGSVYNTEGIVLNNVGIRWKPDENAFHFSEVVVGTLRVNAASQYDVWPVIIEPRGETDSGSDFACTARCFYEGGVAQLELTTPEGKEGNCGYRDRTEIDPDDDEKCYKQIRYLDPCTGEKTRDDELVQIACPGSEE